MLRPELSAALDAFIARSQRRTFSDGLIGGLQIQEYWQAEVPPSGSEQLLCFYYASQTTFDSISAFASAVFLFRSEDDIPALAREAIDLQDQLTPIEVSTFAREWQFHAAKVSDAPIVPADRLANAWSVADDWNDKLFVAVSSSEFFALSWSTSA